MLSAFALREKAERLGIPVETLRMREFDRFSPLTGLLIGLTMGLLGVLLS